MRYLLSKEYLLDKGWEFHSGIMVLKGKTRLGWRVQDHKFYVGYGELPNPIDTIDQVADIMRLCGMGPEAGKFIGGLGLAISYAGICESYRDALNKMWETDGYWIGDDFLTFDVADCYIGNWEVRLIVDNKVDFDTFYEWYCYDEQVRYGKDLCKPEALVVSLEHWIKGFPEELKVPKETRDAWEKEYWDKLREED